MKKLLFLFLLWPSLAFAQSGLLNRWQFEEGSGTTAADSQGGITGTLSNCAVQNCTPAGLPLWITGKVGSSAVQFNGQSSYIKLASYPSVTGDRSVSFWINTATPTVNQVAIYFPSNPGGESSDAISVGIFRDASVLATASAHDQTNTGKGSGAGSIPANVWLHIVVTKSAGAIQKIYINGIDVTTTPSVGQSQSWGIDASFATLGTSDTSWGATGGIEPVVVNGAMDDVRVYDHQLTPAEVTSIFSGGHNYCVDPTGSNSDTGVDPGHCWQTVAKAASVAVAGDFVSIHAGTYHERVSFPTSGTSGNPIVFQGAGASTIIDGSDSLAGITWTQGDSNSCSTSCWYTTQAAIGYLPWNLFDISGGVSRSIWKISDREMYPGNRQNEGMFTGCGGSGCSPSALGFGGGAQTKNGYQILGIPTETAANCLSLNTETSDARCVQPRSTYGAAVPFWDGIEALFGTDGTRVYVRFRDGLSPSTRTVRAAPGPLSRGGSMAGKTPIEIQDKNYITLKNMTVQGGHMGVYVNGTVTGGGSTGIVLDGLNIHGGSFRMYLTGKIDNMQLKNSNIAAQDLGSQIYGDNMWTIFDCSGGLTSTNCGITYTNINNYFVQKFMVGTSDQYDADIYMISTTDGGTLNHATNMDIGPNNTFYRGVAGPTFAGGGDGNEDLHTRFHDFIDRYHSAQGIYMPPGNSIDWQMYDGFIGEGGQYNMRFDSFGNDANHGPYYFYRTKWYRPNDSGHHLSFDSVGSSDMLRTIYWYQSSISGGNECWNPMNGVHSNFQLINVLCSTLRFTDVQASGYHPSNLYLPNARFDSDDNTPSFDNSSLVGAGGQTGPRCWANGTLPDWALTNCPNAVDHGIDVVNGINPVTQAKFNLPGFNPNYWTGNGPDIGVGESSGGVVGTCHISAFPATINQGDSSVISWTCSGVDTQSIDQGIGPVAASGNITVAPSATTTYTITGQPANVQSSAQITVVTGGPPDVSAQIQVVPSSIASNQCATLQWVTSVATSVSIDQGIGTVAASGSQQVCPLSSTTYTITAQGHNGPATNSASLTVTGTTPRTVGVGSGKIMIAGIGAVIVAGGPVSTPPSTGLRHEWKFNEGSGTSAADTISAGSILATLHGSVTWVTGQEGTALNFPGTSADYATLASVPDVSKNSTVTGWFKLTSTASTQVFFAFPTSNLDGLTFGYYATNGTLLATPLDNSSGTGKESSITISAGTKYFFCVSKSQGQITGININGVDRTAAATTAFGVRNIGGAAIGASILEGGVLAPMNGWIDNLEIYGSTFSTADCLALFNSEGP